MRRTLFFMPRKKRAVGKAGRCPAPRQGGCPLDPRPLSLGVHVPERSSPARVRSGKSFQPGKRFSSAAHKARALAGSGPFRTLSYQEGKRANAKRLAASCGLPLVGHELHDKFWSRQTIIGEQGQ